MRIHKLSSLIGSVASATLSAQSGPSCPNGPGSAFGIVAYQCASCGFKQESGQPASYTFFAEPVVTQIDRSAGFASTRPLIIIDGVVHGSAAAGDVAAVGDVIEAVDGHPITTQTGADLFAYPPPGSHSLSVRRGRERQVLDVSVPASCDARRTTIRGASRLGGFRARSDSLRYLGDTVYIRGDTIHRGSGEGSSAGFGAALAERVSAIIDGGRRGGSGAGGGFGRGVPVIGGDSIDAITGVPTNAGGASPAVGKFGFAVECKPSCTLKRTPSGEYYYKYGSFPRIIEVRERSAADRAGLRVGDVITKVEGRSILEDDVLHGSEQRDQLHITVRRNGKDIDAVMVVVR